MNEILFTAVSRNAKTGPVATSMQHGSTCPTSCAMRSACYAKFGPTNLWWQKLNQGTIGITWDAFLVALRRLHRGALFRFSVAGDLPGEGDKIDTTRLSALVSALKDRLAWTYSHKPVLGRVGAANAAAIKSAVENGFTVNLSGNSLRHADKLKALGIAPVVVVLPKDAPNTLFTPAGHKVVVCPAYREGVTCSTCRLCTVAKRSVIVGFRAHGSGAKYAEKIAA